jgi:threonine aldolase
LAAAGLYALDHHLPLLQQDHANAASTAAVLQGLPWVKSVVPPDTNILIFETRDDLPAAKVVAALGTHGVRCLPISPQAVRMVFHLGVSAAQTSMLCQILPLLSFES